MATRIYVTPISNPAAVGAALVRHMLEGRASASAARRLYPDWPGPIPRGLPPAPYPADAGELS
jgi:hypothetical protein